MKYICYSLKKSEYTLFINKWWELLEMMNHHMKLINYGKSEKQRIVKPGDWWGAKKHNWNTGAEENHQLIPEWPRKRKN